MFDSNIYLESSEYKDSINMLAFIIVSIFKIGYTDYFQVYGNFFNGDIIMWQMINENYDYKSKSPFLCNTLIQRYKKNLRRLPNKIS